MAATVRKTNSSEIIATVRDVTVTFDGYLTRALSRVSMDFRRGEVFGILGTKGAGKSTVLKLLAGRVRATEGAVKVLGRSPRRGSIKAKVGYVPGKAGPDRSAGFFSRIFGRKRETQPAAGGGAGLSQAIMGGRDLIILDDPFAETGPVEKAELKTLIRELAGRGKTVIVAGQTLEDTKDVCDRLAILHEGRIQAIGSLEELLNAPGAVRFLAPVLPAEIAVRIAKIIREGFADQSDLKPAVPVAGELPSVMPGEKMPGKPARISSADEQLTALTKANEAAPASEPKPKTDNSIDHGKLEELTKPQKME